MNHIMELLRHVLDEHADHEKMFRFVYKVFTEMNNGVDAELLSFVFELKLLYFIGYGLNFGSCNICDDNESLVFHPSSGGLTCRKHVEQMQDAYEKDVYDKLEWLYLFDINTQTLQEIDANYRSIIRHIIDMLYDEFVGFKSKSLEIIKQLKKY